MIIRGDNMKFAIIEIGSTNTKAYLFENQKLYNLGSQYIPFKTHYKKNNHLEEEDIRTLDTFLSEVKKEVEEVYAFGTSIFRKLSRRERESFASHLKEKFDIDFKVVTAEEESEYTVYGVIENIRYDDKMAVVIGGGGSTEVAIIEKKKIQKKWNLDFGAMDITDHFPELKEDIVKNTSFDEMLTYTLDLIGNMEEYVDVLVLAGGDYLYFYETVGYPMVKNTIYDDDNQPYQLAFDTFNNYDYDILNKSLNAIKEKCPDNAGWWDGARGMRFCMNAVARKLHAKYILPTRINMLIGLANEIARKKKI